MPQKPSIAVVGPGRLGTALALALADAGYGVTEIVSRRVAAARPLARKLKARLLDPREAISAAVVLLCVPDAEIANVAAGLASSSRWRGKVALHASGALPASALAGLRRAGASVASCHPMMSFTRGVRPSLRGVSFAIEGDPRARRVAATIARALGGEPMTIDPARKAVYHAFGAFTSPLLVALFATGERVGAAAALPSARLRKAMAPILRQTLENYLRHGAAAAFTGPLVRGDVGTVKRHLSVLKAVPDAREVYVALVRSAMRNLPVARKAEIAKLLR